MITEAWQGMRGVDLFSVAELEHHCRLMQDLRSNVPCGSRTKLYLGMKGYEPNSFDQWIVLVQDF